MNNQKIYIITLTVVSVCAVLHMFNKIGQNLEMNVTTEEHISPEVNIQTRDINEEMDTERDINLEEDINADENISMEANIQTEEDVHAEMDIKNESYAYTERVILDFLSMTPIQFLEKYKKDDLYQNGILYCGREAWRYDGGQENYNIENITAIRFYKKQSVPIYLNMNIGDRQDQYDEEITIHYNSDYAVSIYSEFADNDLQYIQEISFVKVELNEETAPKDVYDYIEYQYYKVLENLKNETWISSPDGEKAACISNGGIPRLPSQIFIWYEDNKPFTIFRRIGWHKLVGWIDNDHLVCYRVDGYPILVHLERTEIEEIIIEETIREKGGLYTDGAKYSIQGGNLTGQFVFDKQYQWEIQEKDGEIYIVESD